MDLGTLEGDSTTTTEPEAARTHSVRILERGSCLYMVVEASQCNTVYLGTPLEVTKRKAGAESIPYVPTNPND